MGQYWKVHCSKNNDTNYICVDCSQTFDYMRTEMIYHLAIMVEIPILSLVFVLTFKFVSEISIEQIRGVVTAKIQKIKLQKESVSS